MGLTSDQEPVRRLLPHSTGLILCDAAVVQRMAQLTLRQASAGHVCLCISIKAIVALNVTT